MGVYVIPTAIAPSSKTYCLEEVNPAIDLTGAPLGVTFDICVGSAIGLNTVNGVTLYFPLPE